MTKLSRSVVRPLAIWPLGVICLFVITMVGACEQTNGTLPTPTPPPLTAVETAANSTADMAARSSPTSLPDRQLLLWLPPFFADLAEGDMPTAVTAAYAQFERTHPGVHVELQFKNESGEASMLNYLRNAQRLSPTILPDLILIDSQQLWQVADLELVQAVTLDQLANRPDFFPFTVDAVTYNAQLFGIPYATDLIHLVYHKDTVAVIPGTWRELLALGQPYHFVAGKNEGLNEALLVQYLGAGGVFALEDALTNPEVLRALFTFTIEAKAAGVVTEEVLTLASLEQVWEHFIANQASLANTSARLMLSQLDSLAGRNIGYGHIPTSSGGIQTIGHVWAFALVTTDPQQARLALDLINLLLEPTVHSAWGQEVKYMPTTPIAFDGWRTTGDYYDFLRSELEVAVVLPNGRRYADFSKRLQQGYEKVVREEMTPDEAVVYVLATP